MSESKKAYDHQTEAAGFAAETPSAETEHRDTASGSAEGRNELDPERRNEETQYGRRTHQDTKLDPMPGDDA